MFEKKKTPKKLQKIVSPEALALDCLPQGKTTAEAFGLWGVAGRRTLGGNLILVRVFFSGVFLVYFVVFFWGELILVRFSFSWFVFAVLVW